MRRCATSSFSGPGALVVGGRKRHSRQPGRDAGRDALGLLGLNETSQLSIDLDGRLWRVRVGEDDERDIGLVGDDERLSVEVAGRRTSPSSVRLLIDGGVLSGTANRCPAWRSLRWATTVSAERLAASEHRVDVRASGLASTDRFDDPEYGSFVAGTAHLARAQGCGTPERLFGFSESAERHVAADAHLRVAKGGATPMEMP